MELRIRKVGIGDIDHLQEIGKQTFYETFSAANTEENMQQYLKEHFCIDKLTAELSNEDSEFYFAIFDDLVIGYLKLNFGKAQTEVRDEHAVEIERIYVLSSFHGKNVGNLLCHEAIRIAQQRQAPYIWLGVWEENARAIRFYQKNGFTEFDQHIFLLGSDAQTDIMMKLQF